MRIVELAASTGPHLFWVASRAAGIAALMLSSAGVCIGASMSTRVAAGRRAELRVFHEALSLATLGALVVHGVTLLGDSFMSPSLADVAVPFASPYETVWTSAGIVAFWSLALLGISYYARGRIGVQRWRALHRLTALAWLLGLVHALGEGTDAGQGWFLAMVAIVAIPPLLALAALWARRDSAAAKTGAAPVGAAARNPRTATEQP